MLGGGYDGLVPDLDAIKRKVASGLFELTQHAVDQSIQRHISVQELREMISTAEVIEDYPNDKYGPSCLLLGYTMQRRPLHAQVSHPSRPLVKVVTLYEPDPARWIDHRQRRPKND